LILFQQYNLGNPLGNRVLSYALQAVGQSFSLSRPRYFSL